MKGLAPEGVEANSTKLSAGAVRNVVHLLEMLVTYRGPNAWSHARMSDIWINLKIHKYHYMNNLGVSIVWSHTWLLEKRTWYGVNKQKNEDSEARKLPA